MKFRHFSVHARPFFTDAYCECGGTLREVSNGLISVVLLCPKCENAYEPKLVKIPAKKIHPQWLKQARKEVHGKRTNDPADN